MKTDEVPDSRREGRKEALKEVKGSRKCVWNYTRYSDKTSGKQSRTNQNMISIEH